MLTIKDVQTCSTCQNIGCQGSAWTPEEIRAMKREVYGDALQAKATRELAANWQKAIESFTKTGAKSLGRGHFKTSFLLNEAEVVLLAHDWGGGRVESTAQIIASHAMASTSKGFNGMGRIPGLPETRLVNVEGTVGLVVPKVAEYYDSIVDDIPDKALDVFHRCLSKQYRALVGIGERPQFGKLPSGRYIITDWIL